MGGPGSAPWTRADLRRSISRMRTGQRVVTALGVAGLLAGAAFHLVVPGADKATGSLVWIGLGVLPVFAVGVWLTRRRPDHPQPQRMLLAGAAMGVGVGIEGPLRLGFAAVEPPWWLPWLNAATQYSALVASIAFGLVIATYPDGTVERTWQRRVAGALWLPLALPPLLLLTTPTLVVDTWLLDVPPTQPSPAALAWLAWLGPPLLALYTGYWAILVAVALLLARFVRASPAQRRRMGLMLYVMIAGAAVLTAGALLAAFDVPDDAPAAQVVASLYFPVTLSGPAVIVVGVLRHRLFDIDLALRRSLVYAALVLLITGVYVAVVAAPGLAVGGQVPVEVAVGVTVLAGIAFQPLRRRVEAWADRSVFGAKVDRYRLLTTFGSGLEQTVELGQLLPRLADTVRRGLDASWVRVALPGSTVTAGEPSGAPELTVVLSGVDDGRIECGAKPGGYDEGDRELLDTLAGQAGTAIANVRLAGELAERLEELRASRARLVAAAETERRRIERDLHDGVQQHVVALVARIRLARNALGQGRLSDDGLADVQTDAADLLAELRELAHGIHPPVLTDRGLVEAVETRADRVPVPVATHADASLRERRFPPGVEAAAYYVVCEALTNVVKHADARTADVELSAQNGHLRVVVRDDGSGAANTRHGYGLTNLRDRVEAVGGSLRIDGRPGAGSRVAVELPVTGGG